MIPPAEGLSSVRQKFFFRLSQSLARQRSCASFPGRSRTNGIRASCPRARWRAGGPPALPGGTRGIEAEPRRQRVPRQEPGKERKICFWPPKPRVRLRDPGLACATATRLGGWGRGRSVCRPAFRTLTGEALSARRCTRSPGCACARSVRDVQREAGALQAMMSVITRPNTSVSRSWRPWWK